MLFILINCALDLLISFAVLRAAYGNSDRRPSRPVSIRLFMLAVLLFALMAAVITGGGSLVGLAIAVSLAVLCFSLMAFCWASRRSRMIKAGFKW